MSEDKLIREIQSLIESNGGSVKWKELPAHHRAFLKARGIHGETISREDIQQILLGTYVPNVPLSQDVPKALGQIKTLVPNVPSVPTYQDYNLGQIDIVLKAISKVIPKADRPYKKLAFYILFRNVKISDEELRRELHELGKLLLKQEYGDETIRKAISAIKNSGATWTRVDDKTGIVYWGMFDDIKENIRKEVELLLKEKEIQEEQERLKSAEVEKLIDGAYEFLNEFYKNKVFDLFTVKPQKFLVIDWQELLSLNSALAEKAINDPSRTIKAFKEALKRFQIEELFRKEGQVVSVDVHFTNLREVLRPSDIRAEHVGRLVEVKALVSSTADVMSYYTKPAFICRDCGWTKTLVSVSPLKPIHRPKRCEECGSTNIDLEESLSEKVDIQFFEVQDSPEDVNSGQPRRIVGYIIGEQAGILQLGMRVRITAIVRERIFKKGDTPVFDRILEVNHIHVLDKAMSIDELTDEDIVQIKNLKQRHGDELPKMVARSIAPHIFGLEREKLALALSVVSGVKTPAKSRPHIHLLLVGDPGVAKTELVLDLQNIAPKAIISSGTGSTGVGLTASVKKDEFKKGDYVIVGGALVLASGGVCVIDELDKMKPEYLNDLHTALEQQIIPVNKAGINTVLPIDTTVVATANPADHKLRDDEPIVKQLNLKSSLINRFDLIFVVRDNLDKNDFFDGVTEHLLSINDMEIALRKIKADLLRKFLTYARSLRPKFTKEGRDVLKKEFKRLRATYSQGAFPVNLRYFNALMRLAEAYAKLRLSEEITKEDVEIAVRLLESSFKDVATDPNTGQVDVALIYAGATSEELMLREQILEFIRANQSLYQDGVPKSVIIAAFKEKGVDPESVSEYLKHLVVEGRLLMPDDGKYKVLRW